MALALVASRALLGLEAPPVQVEVHLANGLPSFSIVGLPEAEVREAPDRVRSALLNSGFAFPASRRIVVNLAPADLPKESGRFDLPIALGLLAAEGTIPPQALIGHEFAGELSLSGALRLAPGARRAGHGLRHCAPGRQQQRCAVLRAPGRQRRRGRTGGARRRARRQPPERSGGLLVQAARRRQPATGATARSLGR
jgi:magnesium chelatase family protein